MYSKKIADDFEVLEIAKGTWVEAIFAKVKPVVEKIEEDLEEAPVYKHEPADGDDDDDDAAVECDDRYDEDEEDDAFDEDTLDEESYRTTFETDPDDMTIDDVAAAEDEY